ncbi:MAG: hypothetical protein HC888_05355 [Candidatus Competibacteraceae bacterium]|nr:hypothetical protein [Candidatus Competibacteraceae bacterium]
MNEQIDQPVIMNEAAFLAQLLAETAPENWLNTINEHKHKIKAYINIRPADLEQSTIYVIQMQDDSCILPISDDNQSSLAVAQTLQEVIDIISSQPNEVH